MLGQEMRQSWYEVGKRYVVFFPIFLNLNEIYGF